MTNEATQQEEAAAVGESACSAWLSAIVTRLEERQSVVQDGFYCNSELVNELRAAILLDLTIVIRDAVNDVKSR